MHERVSVNPMAMFSVPFADEYAILEDLGVERAGLASLKLNNFGWDASLALVKKSEVETSYLVHGIYTDVDDVAGWATETDLLLRAVDTAADLGAPFVYLSSGPAGRLRFEEARDAFGERMAPVIDRASACGVGLALENGLSIRTEVGFIFTVKDALAVAAQLGIGVCCDLYCCWVESDLRATLAAGAHAIHLVQVSDRDLHSIRQPTRKVPGDGDLPLERLIADVLDAGYTGLFDLELLGPHIEAEGAPSAIARSVTWLSGALEHYGATKVPVAPRQEGK